MQRGYPFVISFCYPETGEPFIVKGREDVVNLKIRSLIKESPCLIHQLYHLEVNDVKFVDGKIIPYKKKAIEKSYHICNVVGFNLSTLRVPRLPSEESKTKSKNKRYFLDYNGKCLKAFRRVPRRWITEVTDEMNKNGILRSQASLKEPSNNIKDYLFTEKLDGRRDARIGRVWERFLSIDSTPINEVDDEDTLF